MFENFEKVHKGIRLNDSQANFRANVVDTATVYDNSGRKNRGNLIQRTVPSTIHEYNHS